MFGSGILDTIVGLLFVFALVSLLVTTVNEMIAAALRSRARWLRYGIERMLGADWARALYRHPLIAGSARSDSLQRGAGPSYIPSRTFANVLMNLIQEQAPGAVASQNQLRDVLDGAPGAGASSSAPAARQPRCGQRRSMSSTPCRSAICARRCTRCRLPTCARRC